MDAQRARDKQSFVNFNSDRSINVKLVNYSLHLARIHIIVRGSSLPCSVVHLQGIDLSHAGLRILA